MSDNPELSVEARLIDYISANLNTITRNIQQFESSAGASLGNTTESSEKLGDTWTEMAKGFIVGEVAVKAFDKLKESMIAGVMEADRELVVMQQLHSTIGESAESILRLSEATEKNTRFSIDDTLSAAKSLQVHKLNGEEIQKLIPVAQDYAAKVGTTAAEAANAFGYAIQYGSTRQLRQFGIEIEKGGSQQSVFNAIIQSGEGSVKGMAQTMGTIGVGGWIEFKNSIESTVKEFDKKLMPEFQTLAEFFKGDGLRAAEGFFNYLYSRIKDVETSMTFFGSLSLGVGNAAEIAQTERMVKDAKNSTELMTIGQALQDRIAKTKYEIADANRKDQDTTKLNLKLMIEENLLAEERNRMMNEFVTKHSEAAKKIKTNLTNTPFNLRSKADTKKDELPQTGSEDFKLSEKARKEALKAKQNYDNELQKLDTENNKQLADNALKFYQDTITGQQHIEDANKKHVKALQDMGIQIGDALASGYEKGKYNTKTAMKAMLDLAVDYVEKWALAAVAANTLENEADLGYVAGTIVSVGEAAAIVAAASIAKSAISSFAIGTRDAPGGLAYVHKDELINLPAHSQVYTKQETKQMMGDTVHFNFYGNTDSTTVDNIQSMLIEANRTGKLKRFKSIMQND
jgi:hypothetical protein